MELSENAKKVLTRRYLKKDEKGNTIETPEEMFRRVANNVASADSLYNKNADIAKISDQFYAIMTNLEFLPNSPTLMNAGRKLQQLSACFVIPVEDSMESIFRAIKETAIIQKTGGGTGFSFSRLRPRGDIVHSTGGEASGPVSFMSVFNAATGVIAQGGKRRGANMGVLRVDHPDIMEFITCKETEGEFENFNISVAATEKFLNAVKKSVSYEVVNPRTNTPTKTLEAEKVFTHIAYQAWKNGEPGIIFIDIINKMQPTPQIGNIESTNPCGEQPLLPYESCNLGSINVSKMVKKTNEKKTGKRNKKERKNFKKSIDWNKLRKTVRIAVHFLDNVIDMNKFPIEKIKEKTTANRKIGLGVMGFADLLVQLNIPYDSDEALETAEAIMKFIKEESHQKSRELAEERGSFPNYEKSIYETPMRNATTTTIAPTGSISIIANCSSSIEPYYALAYKKKAVEEELVMVNPYLEHIAKKEGFHSDELMEKIAETGTVQNQKEVPKKYRKLFKTALEIDYKWHVKMQSAFQKYTDNAVSKTINLPNSATRKDVKDAFLLAHELQCKGITVYRNKSRQGQALSAGKKPRKRAQVTEGTTTKYNIGNCGNLYVTVNEDEQGVCEVFVNMGGEECPPLSEAVGRLISLALRSGVNIEAVLKQIKDIKCTGCMSDENTIVLSCPNAIARTIQSKISEPEEHSKRVRPNAADICPVCDGGMTCQGGCSTCTNCGFTRCE